MKKLLLAATLAVPFVIASCASQPQVAQMSATPESDVGYMNVKDGKRQETLVGSRLARDTRENAESTKTMSRRAYEDGMREKPNPMIGGM